MLNFLKVVKLTLAGSREDEQMVKFSIDGGNVEVAGSWIEFKDLLEGQHEQLQGGGHRERSEFDEKGRSILIEG